MAAAQVVSLRPTYQHPRAGHYLRPGGPWDGPTLDAALSARRSDRDAVVDPAAGVRLSHSELGDRIEQLAGGLRTAGVRRGDVVAWQAPNGYRPLLLFRACWRLGAVAAPIHHQASTTEAERMLAQVGPRLTLWPDDVAGERFVQLSQGARVRESAAEPDDIGVVLFTSGSTGEAKAALHTQRGLSYKAQTMVAAHGLTPGDATLTPAPLAHISGLLNAVLLGGVTPITAIPMARWDPERALELVRDERVSFMIGPPTFFVSLMHASGFTTESVATLRLVSCGGAGVTPAFVEDASERLGARVKRTYGSTEAPTVTTTTPSDSARDARETDGRAVGEVELRLSSTGELALRGPELFVGYADAEQTSQAIDDGWFRTGDLARIDDGWLTIVGRIKDVIIRGGENIAAGEIEAVLEAHPSVRQAVAVGQPDEVMGERVCAFVVADPPFDLEACRRWFAERGIARFKTPERVVRLDELPLLAAGKPDRAALVRLADDASLGRK